ncbi:MAG: cupredoxin domain-containing protein [Asgard group archaeon]|nr:cupredoxin domain-containing protein [Asgard group archaeon]
MRKKTSNLLWIISIITLLFAGQCLAINAKNESINNDYSPNIFDIGTVDISIDVSTEGFTPSSFRVKESATVNMTVSSIDVGHTFEIEEYEIEESIPANTTVIFTFEADQVGSFTYTSINSSETGTMYVESPYVPDLPRPENVTIMFDFTHHTNVSDVGLKYSSILNWTNDNGFNLIINDEYELIYDGTLDDVDVLLLFEPDLAFEEPEIEGIQTFLQSGGSMLIAGSPNASQINVNEITSQYGITFTNKTAGYINETGYSDPVGINNTLDSFTITEFNDHPIITEDQYVPLTSELVTYLKYSGIVIEQNQTVLSNFISNENLTRSGEAFDLYSLAQGNETIFGDVNANGVVNENETIGSSNVFISALEHSEGGRLLAVGAAEIFNNSRIGRNPANEHFFQRCLQWLGKMYAVLQSNSFEISTNRIDLGKTFNATLAIHAQNKTIIPNVTINLRIFQVSVIVERFDYQANNDTFYTATINTNELHKGTFYLNTLAHKRGYGYNKTATIYFEVYPIEPEPFEVSVLYMILFVLSIGIGAVAISFFVITIRQSPEKSLTEKPSEELSLDLDEDLLEEDEEIDLDEYEVE